MLPTNQINCASDTLSKVITDEGLVVTLTIPLDFITSGWRDLAPIFEGCPDHQMMMELSEVNDEELRARCALLAYAYSLMPMSSFELHNWAKRIDPADYTDWFVASVLSQDDDFAILREMEAEKLDALTSHLVKAQNRAGQAV